MSEDIIARAKRAAARLNSELNANSEKLSVVLSADLPSVTPAPCESGAALDCAGTGIERQQPEAMLTGDREYQNLCTPCYEYHAGRYVRVAHRMDANR